MAIRGNVTLNTNKKKIYWCKKNDKLNPNDADTFQEPIEIFEIVTPVSTESEITAYGEQFVNVRYIYTDIASAKNFKNDDRFYIDKLPPDEHNKLQNKAADGNFYVNADPMSYINTGRIRLLHITGR